MKIKIKLFEGGRMPEFKTAGAVCADCYARLEEDVVIPCGKRALIPLGFAAELPKNWELQVRPRSGLTSREIDIGNGTGDWDYRGEYKACVINNSDSPFTVKMATESAKPQFEKLQKLNLKRFLNFLLQIEAKADLVTLV